MSGVRLWALSWFALWALVVIWSPFGLWLIDVPLGFFIASAIVWPVGMLVMVIVGMFKLATDTSEEVN